MPLFNEGLSIKNVPPLGQALSYVWIDTCCIDKTSSAELSEAINSMYQWYQDAAICYAYLSDVHKPVNDQAPNADLVTGSAWFSRGWTLQELIAPVDLVFFDRDWNELGTKVELSSQIALRTGVPETVIKNITSSSEQPAAAVLSWAASRSTTREEDRAYSLLGLLGVNMPLLYGEGFRAFHRLEEILLTSRDDTTVLAWNKRTDCINSTSSIFATSPSDYGEICGKLRPLAEAWELTSAKGATLNNKGLSLPTYVVALSYHVYFVPLAYITMGRQWIQPFGMVIERWEDGLFRRLFTADSQCLFRVPPFEFEWQYLLLDITIARDSMQDWDRLRLTPSFFHPQVWPSHKQYFHHRTKGHVNPQQHVILANSCHGISDIISVRRSKSRVSFFLLGLNIEFIPFCLFITTKYDRQKPIDPDHAKIRSDKDPTRELVIGNQKDMMGLVMELEERSGRYQNRTSTDIIEMYLMLKVQTGATLAKNEGVFVTSDGIRIKLRMENGPMDSLTIELFATIDFTPATGELQSRHTVGQWQAVTGQQNLSPRCINNWPRILADLESIGEENSASNAQTEAEDLRLHSYDDQ